MGLVSSTNRWKIRDNPPTFNAARGKIYNTGELMSGISPPGLTGGNEYCCLLYHSLGTRRAGTSFIVCTTS